MVCKQVGLTQDWLVAPGRVDTLGIGEWIWPIKAGDLSL
jgi:hypothetical protein